MKKIIAATNNMGKLIEIQEILKDKYEVITLSQAGLEIDVDETGATFFDNALLKAKAVYERLKIPALSDDSGLCVTALNGAPGVYSARYSGIRSDKANNALLLKNLNNAEDRSAKFVCAIVLYYSEDKYIEGYGETSGRILEKEEGDGGFGYDPLFYSYELNKSFGTAQNSEKNRISHRKRAIENLLNKTAQKRI